MEKKPFGVKNLERAARVSERHAKQLKEGRKETLWQKFQIRFAAFDAGANVGIPEVRNSFAVLTRTKAGKFDSKLRKEIAELAQKYPFAYLWGALLTSGATLGYSILKAFQAQPHIVANVIRDMNQEAYGSQIKQ